MEIIIYVAIAAVLAFAVGVLVAGTVLKKQVLKKSNLLLEEAKEKAEVVKKDKILQAKEKFLQLKSEHEKVINEENIDPEKGNGHLQNNR